MTKVLDKVCGRQSLYTDGACLRLGTRSKPAPASAVLGSMSKGEARRVRKALRRQGYAGLAAAPRN